MKPKFCACIETLYTELPFLDRFRAAVKNGFDAVEFWSWTNKDLAAARAAAEETGAAMNPEALNVTTAEAAGAIINA